jgi:hypothetical protein
VGRVVGTLGAIVTAGLKLTTATVDINVKTERIVALGRRAMRRWLFLTLVAGSTLANTGCFINIYSSDPNIRMRQLLNQSEDLRVVEEEWMRIWFTDQPSHLNPQRIHGGIQ